MSKTLEPKDKLDADTTPAGVKANGPGDAALDWNAVDWRAAEAEVRRLRQRIFAATRAGDFKRVRSLQKLMLRSRANTLVSVRQAAERNAGRFTPGIDGQVALSALAKQELVTAVQQSPFHARAVRRVFIPKANGKLRPLGIPVILDRAQQTRVRHALEPEWEARFEPRSYGFRPGRSCHDAIEAIHQLIKGKDPKRQWILDADLQGAFDHINHEFALGLIGSFPGREMIRAWLKAGVVEKGHFTPTQEGAPQGGAISPLILNIVLHGMEAAAGVRYRYRSRGLETVYDGPGLVRYADDLLAFCHSRQQAEQVKERLALWLAPRGLVFNEDKTRIVHVNQGCDFLGFNIRRYHNKLPLIKPSKDAVRRLRERLRTETRIHLGGNAASLLRALTPIVRGWAAFYRHQVSSEIFSALDNYMFKLLYKWIRRTHPNKGRWWRMDRYFGRFNPARNNRWVFGDKDTGSYLPKFAWTKIVRHVMVVGASSPDDPALAHYWAGRRHRKPNGPLNVLLLAQLKLQRGRCWSCGTRLLNTDRDPESPSEWEFWLRAIQATIRRKTVAIREDRTDQRLIHTTCRDRTSAPALPALLAATP